MRKSQKCSAKVINGWVYVPKSEVSHWVLGELTLATDDGSERELFIDAGDSVALPRAYAYQFGAELDCPGSRPLSREYPPIPLRDYQPPAVEDIEAALRLKHGAILHAEGGTGKTVMGLEVARRLGEKMVVFVHAEFLVDQWVERVRQFLPGAEVGRIQGPQRDTGDDYDVVVAMVQTVAANLGPEMRAVLSTFNTVIFDEAHRYGAEAWQRVFEVVPCRYRLGLTGTPIRRDGMTAVILSHIGAIEHTLAAGSMKARVYMIDTGVKVPAKKYRNAWDGSVNFSNLTSALCGESARDELAMYRLKRCYEAGRKTLVLTERLNHVDRLVELVREFCPEVSKFVGGMKAGPRAEAVRARVMVATYQNVKEALDVAELDTLVFMTPKTTIEQACWRVTRFLPDKRQPLIFDFVDETIAVCYNMSRSRRNLYDRLGYEVSKI